MNPATRKIMVVVVLIVCTWYIVVMSRNAVPHGADRTRHEQPFPVVTP